MASSINGTTPYVPLTGGSISVPTIDVHITGSQACFDAVCGKYVVGRNANTSSCFGVPSYFNHTIPLALQGNKCAGGMSDIHASWATNSKTGELIPFISNTDKEYPFKCTFSNFECAAQICHLQRQPTNDTTDGKAVCYSDPVIANPPAFWLPKLANVSADCAREPVTCEVVGGRSAPVYSAASAPDVPKSLFLLGVASAALGLMGVAGL